MCNVSLKFEKKYSNLYLNLVLKLEILVWFLIHYNTVHRSTEK